MYRPKKWDEITCSLGFATEYTCASSELAAFDDGVEAGADALLKGLIKTSLVDICEFGADEGDRLSFTFPTELKGSFARGNLVYIPKEDTDKKWDWE